MGISHFVIYPNKLRCENVLFDVFHLGTAINKHLMVYLRKFMLSQTFEIMSKVSGSVLDKFGGHYQIFVWNQDKVFSSFTGNGPIQMSLPCNYKSNIWILAIANNNPITAEQMVTDLQSHQLHNRNATVHICIALRNDATKTKIQTY